jgi:hypothetical protein
MRGALLAVKVVLLLGLTLAVAGYARDAGATRPEDAAPSASGASSDASTLESQTPKAGSKMTYVLPFYPGFSSGTDAQFAAEVASLRSRLGEGRFVRVGFNRYVFTSMDRWDVDPADRETVRANLKSTLAQIDAAVARAKGAGIPLSLSLLTAIRERYDPVQTGAEREDRRNTQWYSNGDLAPGWITLSRYARRMRGRYEAYVREIGAHFAATMAREPATLVAASGDGEVELSYDRDRLPASLDITDYSPFAIAEFRDWLRNGGLYAPGQTYAGQGYAQAARYQGDTSPAVDSNGDGHTLNADFGTSFTTWSLRHFDWSLADDPSADPNTIPATTYERAGFSARPGTDPSRFDAPRTRQVGNAWWEVWDRFRQEMVWHYNIDFAQWITTSPDPVTGATVPTDRWFSHQIPADYLFGFSPDNPNGRLVTSASPHWTADISPYGSLGITSFNVNLGSRGFAETLSTVIPHIAARGRRWAILEWNPSIPPSSSVDIYAKDAALVERYRPAVVIPWAWGDPEYQVNGPFETALRAMIARIKDTPPSAAVATSDASDVGVTPPDVRTLLDILHGLPDRQRVRDRQWRADPVVSPEAPR